MESVLAVVACLSTEPLCEVHVLSNPLPRVQCVTISQPLAAQWAGEHPNQKISRIFCADPKELSNMLGRTRA
ncbi:hypothetical protein ATN84_18880 [Paramesorhizobium deserti]|uniref:Uncharacterized protein n=1 Tax=Paramesorhizobium deserti TaxID=1494590 RepID=A0A135HQC1_9HYPH|nr:hypothetical protein ATN84_18880 [Paramesorhizobium deserti]